MSKATLTFDLDDFDDRLEHLRCVKSLDMALVIWELATNGNCNRKRLNELLREHDINIEQLIV
jgi:hypothetical protein